jgi:hypothetical protein
MGTSLGDFLSQGIKIGTGKSPGTQSEGGFKKVTEREKASDKWIKESMSKRSAKPWPEKTSGSSEWRNPNPLYDWEGAGGLIGHRTKIPDMRGID